MFWRAEKGAARQKAEIATRRLARMAKEKGLLSATGTAFASCIISARECEPPAFMLARNVRGGVVAKARRLIAYRGNLLRLS